MKKLILALSVVLVSFIGINSFAQDGRVVIAGQNDGPVITVDKDIHDYGNIKYGSGGKCVFTITNTGDAPLIISKCHGSCGCTTPSCVVDRPIMPGQSTEIVVKYDTKRTGPFQKTVYITSNAENTPRLEVKIKGVVGGKVVPAGSTAN